MMESRKLKQVKAEVERLRDINLSRLVSPRTPKEDIDILRGSIYALDQVLLYLNKQGDTHD